MMRITIKDIARETGYSKTTVSFAFNDPKQISASTREKILATATRLGYVPDPVARSLSRRRMGTIGVLLPQSIQFTLGNPYMVELISGIGEACADSELSLTLIPPKRGSLIASVRSAAVDGLVTIGLEPEDEAVQLIRHRHVPFVTVDAHPHEGVPAVTIDDRAGAKLAMDHVLAAGHRAIAVVMLEDSSSAEYEEYSGIGRSRMEGYEEALAGYGLSISSSEILRIDQPCSFEGGVSAARVIAERAEPPTAAVVMSDIQAAGVVIELHRLGITVPDQISVVGFDDIREAQLLAPALTTVRQPAQEKGRAAGELLTRMIRGETTETHVELACSLVERASVTRLSQAQ